MNNKAELVNPRYQHAVLTFCAILLLMQIIERKQDISPGNW